MTDDVGVFRAKQAAAARENMKPVHKMLGATLQSVAIVAARVAGQEFDKLSPQMQRAYVDVAFAVIVTYEEGITQACDLYEESVFTLAKGVTVEEREQNRAENRPAVKAMLDAMMQSALQSFQLAAARPQVGAAPS